MANAAGLHTKDYVKLKSDFKEDVQKLSKIINRDLTHWTKKWLNQIY